jgi:hypothetical protein
MRKIAITVSVAICLGLVLFASLWAQNAEPGAPADAPTDAPARWQHLALHAEKGGIVTDPNLGRQINRLGDEGWELVDVETVIENGTTQKAVYFFKRPR